ncbi:uncharacterized protein LOC124258355 isoform X2 [Haliotis rubra]|uniref:uncharacterized protein LOC124258355 isoform X2 n=1 Tax=Haliotis rubra TaxID=36100 RepID=UPI001EE5F063|nr:uncharacterized protein LOC124258355 isoform X2 [Haliotis rubra]
MSLCAIIPRMEFDTGRSTESQIWSTAFRQVSDIAWDILSSQRSRTNISSVLSEERLQEVAERIYYLSSDSLLPAQYGVCNGRDLCESSREDLGGSKLLDLQHSCDSVETCYIDGWSYAHNLNTTLNKGLYEVPEQYAAHAVSGVRRPTQCVGRLTALTGRNISSTDSHDLLTLAHTVSWPQIDYCPSHCVFWLNLLYPLFELNERQASTPIVPTRPVMAGLAESCRPVRAEGGIPLYGQRDSSFDRHLRDVGLISVDGSVDDMVLEHLYQLCSQHNLIQFYQELHSQYMFELYLWLYVRICVDRKMQKVQQKLEIISRILGQPVECVLRSTLTSFVQKLVSKQKHLVDSALILLRQVDIGEVTPMLASHLRDLARTTNIQLDSKRLQRKFSRDVAITARRILMEYQNGLVSKFSSPGTRRRTTRERNTLRQSESPERRAFQPPVLTGRQLHPAAVLPGQSPQHPVVIDVDQVQVSAPVTMTPYAIPVCTGPHHMPVCSAAHMQMCNTQPTWSIPACTVQLPSCSMQHIPACSLQQMPVPHTIPPILHHTHHPPPHHPMPHHHGLTHAGHAQFPHVPQPQMRDEDVQIIAEHRPHYPIPPSIHPGATLNPSPPVILQEPVVHPTPHDIYMGPYQLYYARRAAGRSRLRGSLPPPPPPYPGFLLHFLAMLGNPPVPPYGRDPPDEATEENYEALLSLAERLGEAKPRGLSKADIKQLPAYYFNSETPRSDLDQTSCVVCMCDFESRQLLRVLPCGHEFHTKCVDKWLKTNRTCPICRADATDMAGNHSE